MRGVDKTAAVLPFRKSDTNLPDAGRLITALRQIGYSLEQAIADLIDNSINAGAGTVLLRFMHDGARITAVAIVDDGCGMDEAGLHNAMRFGSTATDSMGSLGKFGMGLKLASLSHAQRLAVHSRKSGAACGRQWTLEGIERGWWCERLNPAVSAELLDRRWGSLDTAVAGTLVLWEQLDKLPSHRRGLKYTLTSLETRLRLHLGLCFHRFLENGSLRILIDQQLESRVGQGLQAEIAPLNPFGYEVSGHADYPRVMTAELSGVGPLSLQTHIWPAYSELPEYKLGRRTAARQGFYFYRNHRLIQAGGWNGLLQDETEPHSSLARIQVDLPEEYDSHFGINVQKSTVLVPTVFEEVLAGRAEDGHSFEDFRRDAIAVYRSASGGLSSAGRFPETGLEGPVLERLRSLYSRPSDSEGFRLVWSRLRSDEFFRLDHENRRLMLNRDFRSAADDTVKLLTALVLRNDLASEPRPARRKELDAINELLLSTMKNR